jgi:hypothetical protein
MAKVTTRKRSTVTMSMYLGNGKGVEEGYASIHGNDRQEMDVPGEGVAQGFEDVGEVSQETNRP